MSLNSSNGFNSINIWMCIMVYTVANCENFSAFIQEFRNWDSAWALEALYVVVYEIRVLAERVSIEYFVFFPTH